MRARALGPVEALVQREALGDLPHDGVQRVQARHRLLEDEADVVAAHAAELARGGGGHLPAAVLDRAGDLGVVGEELHGGERGDRLAGAELADERQRLAGVELEADAADRLGQARRPAGTATRRSRTARSGSGSGELAGVLHHPARSAAPLPGGAVEAEAHPRRGPAGDVELLRLDMDGAEPGGRDLRAEVGRVDVEPDLGRHARRRGRASAASTRGSVRPPQKARSRKVKPMAMPSGRSGGR